jgi:uncharacterized coiled-coil protein SlyX
MSNFTIIQQQDNTYLLKFDMGLTCYKGIIYQNSFPEELKLNYIEVINEAIQYFLTDSPKDPKIVSMFEFPNTYDINYFLISFYKNDQFVKYQRYIKIEMQKINKTIDDYLFEFDQRISTNKNSLYNQKIVTDELNKKIELQQNEIKLLKDTINEINENFKNILYQQSINQQNNSNKNNSPIITSSFVSPHSFQLEVKKEHITPNIFSIPQNLEAKKEQPIPFLFEQNNNINFKNLSENKNTKIDNTNKILTNPINSIMPYQYKDKMEIEESKKKTNPGFIFNISNSKETIVKNNEEVLFPYLNDDKK